MPGVKVDAASRAETIRHAVFPVAAESFRETMASVCTPVTVVTTCEDGHPHGTTVSAFASLSIDPPLVSIALDGASDLLALARRSGRVGVNVLAHDQHDLALRFARKGDDKFAGLDWHEEEGLPRLPGTVGWLGCRVEEVVVGGDHEIVIAAVESVAPGESAPLVYHRRRFGTHSAFLDPRETAGGEA
jgi:flavin reductase (DIM6/NTAB) family NADH-FMN oxidoreductase RutF